jgi:hypothetical protein
MGVVSTQGFVFKLVANDTILDLFADEEIKLSDNVTGLFDLGVLPTDFTRQIQLPGTKKNNAFFEHVYDISVYSPDTFATNIKVPCYIDFDGLYLAQGYLQLNKVNVIANKFIDSYEVTIFGALSSFGIQVNKKYLTDLTSLSQYNHSSSLYNITGSWDGNLFNGDIVYPLVEYGQKIEYTPEEDDFGIDSVNGGLCVQDFKPAIRVKAVLDAIFSEAGFTYSSSFLNQSWLDDVYMICNNKLRYPLYSNANIETFGLFKIAPISGSNQTNWNVAASTDYLFPWYNILENPGGQLEGNLTYRLPYQSSLRGVVQLNFEMSGSGGSNYVPQFNLKVVNVDSAASQTVALDVINEYLSDVKQYNSTDGTKPQKIVTSQQFTTPLLSSGSYNFKFNYSLLGSGGGTTTVTLEPDNQIKSYLEVTKVSQLGDGWIMDIPANMPYGTIGIKQIDFIKGLQKKFNLVIYPSKTVKNEFIIETFNDWYKRGTIKDFNKYINLDDKIEVIPANNFAVNELNFGDTLDQDYISQQFSKAANREFGKSYFVDTQNFFSQGKFEVKTTFASSPLIKITNTGVSGSVQGITPGPNPVVYTGTIQLSPSTNYTTACRAGTAYVYSAEGTIAPGVILYYDNGGTTPIYGIRTIVWSDYDCSIWVTDPSTGEVLYNTGETCQYYGGCI